MREIGQSPRFLGYVHVRVGAEVVALSVQAVPFRHDGGTETPGGFFQDSTSGDCGILVDSEASDRDVRDQIDRAIVDAVQHISKRVLN